MVTGRTRFGADRHLPDMLHLGFVGSPVAHGRLVGVDATEALGVPGVVAVLTAGDLGLAPFCQVDAFAAATRQPPLASGHVRHVGERVAAVLAIDEVALADALAAVSVEVDPLPAVVEPDAATAVGAPQLHGDAAPSNVVGEWRLGDPDATRDAFERAAVTVRLELRQPRVCVAPLEGTTVLAVPEPGGALTVHVGAQMPAEVHGDLCRDLGLARQQLRVVGLPMGGAFGGKTTGGSPDISVPAACALRFGRPVRHIEPRGANLVAMQARDQRQTVELAADSDGRLLALRLRIRCPVGAYPATGALEPLKSLLLAPGPYRFESVDVSACSVVTNTPPTGAYRGPGRAESTAALERALDVLAARLGIDPVELRRANLLARHELPSTSVTGCVYDTADHHATLDAALALAEVGEWRRRQEAARAVPDGLQYGVGVSTWVDATAGFRADQAVRLWWVPEGRVQVAPGTASSGQGHASVFGELVASRLGVDATLVDVADPDTAVLADAVGSFGSRSAQVAGSAVAQGCDELVAVARRLAAHLLEAAPADVEHRGDGTFAVAGVPARSLTWAELVEASYRLGESGELPGGVAPGLGVDGRFHQLDRTYPAGCHVAVVEVDPPTGAVRLVRLVSATDCGTVLHPAVAEGQLVGASVQGAAHALWEEVVFDDDATPLTSSLATYAMPSAAELCGVEVTFCGVPTSRNPLGVKGVAEAGTVGAPAAVQNAVVDALTHLGVEHVDQPCTPERVWRAIAGHHRGKDHS